MASRKRDIRLPAPYLKKIWLDAAKVGDPAQYPFCLPLFKGGFEQMFDNPITIIAGENGTGKSTLLEGIAALAGFDQSGGAKGYCRWTIPARRKSVGRRSPQRSRQAGCPSCRMAGFSVLKASFLWRGISIRPKVPPPISCLIRMERAFFVFLKSVVTGKACIFLTNRRLRSRPRGRSNS
jgi:hypothetical protein